MGPIIAFVALSAVICVCIITSMVRISSDFLDHDNRVLTEQHIRMGAASEPKPKNVPPFKLEPIYQEEHNRIDSEDAETKCRRYGLKPSPGPPRRIFYGAMVADDNFELLVMSAIESYDVFHAAVFVESNTTHMATPREMRFYASTERDMLERSGMFGARAKVYMSYWLEDFPELKWMERESEQRNRIIQVWKEAGMKPDDVGLMSDVDELVSRDFLRAVQTCDFPELRPEQTCQKPKIIPGALAFEASPFCMRKPAWFHPDFISGQCIEGIGDPTERVVPLRAFNRQYGERHESYGKNDYNRFHKAIVESQRYPLFSGPDIRTVHGADALYTPDTLETTTAVYGAAYHLHNWFQDLRVLRNKYATYAHGDDSVMKKTLSQASEDLDTLVRCARGLGNEVNPMAWKVDYHVDGSKLKGSRPIYFLNATYTTERHEAVKKMLLEDEKVHGSSYDANGKFVEEPYVEE